MLYKRRIILLKYSEDVIKDVQVELCSGERNSSFLTLLDMCEVGGLHQVKWTFAAASLAVGKKNALIIKVTRPGPSISPLSYLDTRLSVSFCKFLISKY